MLSVNIVIRTIQGNFRAGSASAAVGEEERSIALGLRNGGCESDIKL